MQSTSLQETAPSTKQKRGLNFRLRRIWLPRLWWLWTGGAVIVSTFLMLAGPLTPFTGLEDQYVALAVVPFMMVMLASGLVWLVMLVNTPPSRRCAARPVGRQTSPRS